MHKVGGLADNFKCIEKLTSVALNIVLCIQGSLEEPAKNSKTRVRIKTIRLLEKFCPLLL